MAATNSSEKDKPTSLENRFFEWFGKKDLSFWGALGRYLIIPPITVIAMFIFLGTILKHWFIFVFSEESPQQNNYKRGDK